MNAKIQAPKNPLRPKYGLHMQIGLILSLLTMIGIFNIEIKYEPAVIEVDDNPKVITTVDIPRTEFIKIPPKPVLPVVPVPVSNDAIIDDLIDFNSDDLNIDLKPIAEAPKVEDEPTPFMPIEHQPEIVGGIKELYKHINYPDVARQVGIEGKVILQFKVNTNGKLSDIKVVRGIGGGCDEEAIKAVQKIKFKPGLQRGRPVAVNYTLPITFKLKK
ncbi:energy transducer TonB [bacterium]|nr:MAG: energy transducer TonB [bacterium]